MSQELGEAGELSTAASAVRRLSQGGRQRRLGSGESVGEGVVVEAGRQRRARLTGLRGRVDRQPNLP
jgi:hypothetical protein